MTPWQASGQVLVVRTDGWESTAGEALALERDSIELPWRAARSLFPVVVGRRGMGWGRGLHDPGWASAQHPVKREGDDRSPAGVFRIEAAFGTAAAEAAGIRLWYFRCTSELRWVDDPASPLYNRPVLAPPGEETPWRSAEVMLRGDGLYELGVVVGHNLDPIEPGAGSCIFLHLWQDRDHSTSGCTAMARADLEWLAGWLNPAADPMLIQLPRPVLAAVALDREFAGC